MATLVHRCWDVRLYIKGYPIDGAYPGQVFQASAEVYKGDYYDDGSVISGPAPGIGVAFLFGEGTQIGGGTTDEYGITPSVNVTLPEALPGTWPLYARITGSCDETWCSTVPVPPYSFDVELTSESLYVWSKPVNIIVLEPCDCFRLQLETPTADTKVNIHGGEEIFIKAYLERRTIADGVVLATGPAPGVRAYLYRGDVPVLSTYSNENGYITFTYKAPLETEDTLYEMRVVVWDSHLPLHPPNCTSEVYDLIGWTFPDPWLQESFGLLVSENDPVLVSYCSAAVAEGLPAQMASGSSTNITIRATKTELWQNPDGTWNLGATTPYVGLVAWQWGEMTSLSFIVTDSEGLAQLTLDASLPEGTYTLYLGTPPSLEASAICTGFASVLVPDGAYACNPSNYCTTQYTVEVGSEVCVYGDKYCDVETRTFYECGFDSQWVETGTCDCDESTPQPTETCPDGSTITTATCINNQWVETSDTCPEVVCVDGDTVTATCPDGSTIISSKCIGGEWYPQQVCPPDENGGEEEPEEEDDKTYLYIAGAVGGLALLLLLMGGRRRRDREDYDL